jgi:hypothetical protein
MLINKAMGICLSNSKKQKIRGSINSFPLSDGSENSNLHYPKEVGNGAGSKPGRLAGLRRYTSTETAYLPDRLQFFSVQDSYMGD